MDRARVLRLARGHALHLVDTLDRAMRDARTVSDVAALYAAVHQFAVTTTVILDTAATEMLGAGELEALTEFRQKLAHDFYTVTQSANPTVAAEALGYDLPTTLAVVVLHPDGRQTRESLSGKFTRGLLRQRYDWVDPQVRHLPWREVLCYDRLMVGDVNVEAVKLSARSKEGRAVIRGPALLVKFPSEETAPDAQKRTH